MASTSPFEASTSPSRARTSPSQECTSPSGASTSKVLLKYQTKTSPVCNKIMTEEEKNSGQLELMFGSLELEFRGGDPNFFLQILSSLVNVRLQGGGWVGGQKVNIVIVFGLTLAQPCASRTNCISYYSVHPIYIFFIKSGEFLQAGYHCKFLPFFLPHNLIHVCKNTPHQTNNREQTEWDKQQSFIVLP